MSKFKTKGLEDFKKREFKGLNLSEDDIHANISLKMNGSSSGGKFNIL